jgi:hypothetical protein
MGFLTGLTFVMLTFLPIFGLVGGIWEPILRTGASVGMGPTRSRPRAEPCAPGRKWERSPGPTSRNSARSESGM